MDPVVGPSVIVIFSHDSSLLTTRQWLLETLGCTVFSVMRFTDFEERLRTHPITVVILCQSLKPEECQEADRCAEENRPGALLLLMLGARQKYISDRECMLLDANCGPLVFVSTVERLLRPSGGSTAVIH